jgi:AcrR family transcriptional regulator
LTQETILDTAEEVLRRFGPVKTTVVDVARALDVSHGTVYRHFASKGALRDAVTRRWLERVSAPLAEVVAGPGPADEKLRRWVRLLASTKQGIAREDPELFATFRAVSAAGGQVIDAHVEHLVEQLTVIVRDGVAAGELVSADPAVTGRALLQATALFHHPAHADEWGDPLLDERLAAVLDLVVRGILPA